MKTERFLFDGVPVSARALRVLSALGHETWGEVATTSPLDFLRHPRCGAVTVRELLGHLAGRSGLLVQSQWALIATSTRETRP